MDNPTSSPRVVILGAGFGGVYAARELQRASSDAKLRVTVVNRENYFLFTPLLHEVATGGLAPHTIVEPLRSVLGGETEIRLADVRRVRLADKVVETSVGEIPFDALIVALGAETNFFGTPGAEQHAFTLKSMRDAIRLKQRCIDAFERAAVAATDAERQKLLQFAIVGGGPTGVELAAELIEFIEGSLVPLYRPALGEATAGVTLVQAAPELLPPFAPETRKKALETLQHKHVIVRLSASVTSVDMDGLTLADGQRVEAETVVWVAGVKPSPVIFDREIERDRGGRIVVDEALQLKGTPNVFVIGDIACAIPKGGSAPLPPFAQVASRQAVRAADNVRCALGGQSPTPFVYRHMGNLVSLGQWMAAAEIGPFRFWGHFTWWMWRTVYLTKFISMRKKFSIALQWTINLFTTRDVTRIHP